MPKMQIDHDNILYDDGIILIANKPAGIPSQGTDDPNKDHFYAALKRVVKDSELVLHHRLDSGTSGLMVFGRNRKYNRQMTDLFRERKIKKSYLALVSHSGGIPTQFSSDRPIKKVRKGRFLVSLLDECGDHAQTDFKVINSTPERALVECFPLTGRMHQVRVHLSGLGYPIVGDFVYARELKALRMMLHAWKVSFPHPKSGAEMIFEAPIPKELKLE